MELRIPPIARMNWIIMIDFRPGRVICHIWPQRFAPSIRADSYRVGSIADNVEKYKTDDADYVIITLGSISGLCRETADSLRERGVKAGVLRLRYLRPFPEKEIAEAVKNAKAIAVLEKDISFGNEGTVYTNVNSALHKNGSTVPTYNFIGGLGGRNISREDILGIYEHMKNGGEKLNFIGIGGGQQ